MGSRPFIPSHAHMARLYAVETIKQTVSIYVRTKTKESHALAIITKTLLLLFYNLSVGVEFFIFIVLVVSEFSIMISLIKDCC